MVKFWFVDIAMKFVHFLFGLTRAEFAFCIPCGTWQTQRDTFVHMVPFPHAGPVLSAATRAVGLCICICVSNANMFPTLLVIVFKCCSFAYPFADMFDIGCFSVLEFRIFTFGPCIPNVAQFWCFIHFGLKHFLFRISVN